MREKKHAHTGCSCKNVATNLSMRWRSSFGHGTGSWAVALKKTATTAQQVTSHSSRTTSPAYLSPRLSSFGCARDADGYQARHSPCDGESEPVQVLSVHVHAAKNKSLYHSIFFMATAAASSKSVSTSVISLVGLNFSQLVVLVPWRR